LDEKKKILAENKRQKIQEINVHKEFEDHKNEKSSINELKNDKFQRTPLNESYEKSKIGLSDNHSVEKSKKKRSERRIN